MSDLTLTLPTASAYLAPEPLVAQPPRQLLTPLPTPGHFLLVIDNSSLEVFTTCPKSADYKLVRRREAHAKNAALTFGGAIHEGLERFLRYQSECGTYDCEEQEEFEKERAIRESDARIVSFFTNNPAPLDEYRTLPNALAVLAAYRQRATLPDYAWEIQSDASGPIIERAFELPLGVVEIGDWVEMPWLSEADKQRQWDAGLGDNPPRNESTTAIFVSHIHIAWSGRIDAVARCGQPNVVRVIDHKTTSIMGDSFMQDFVISNQVLGYVWAARQLWPSFDISAFCVNAIHFKKPTGNGSITAPGPRGGPAALQFVRGYFDYTPERVDQWAENTLAIVSDFIHCLIRNYWPRHTKWCLGKYGRCQYHDVCSQHNPAVRNNMIMSDMFKTVTWNPVNGR